MKAQTLVLIFTSIAFASYSFDVSSGSGVAARTIPGLPEWMKPLYNHGLLATLDDNGEVASVTTGGIMNDELLAKVKMLPRLRELNIEVTKEITSAGLEQLAELRMLEKLSLAQTDPDGPGLGDAAIRSVAGLPTLRELSLNECGTTDAGASLLEWLPQLTAVSFYQEGRLTDNALKSIGKLSRLKSLALNSYVATKRLGRMRFSASAIRHLSGLKNLETLLLVGHDVPADALDFPKLRRLSLGGPSVDDAVATRIGMLHELREIELSYTSVGDGGMRHITGLSNLQRLDLSSQVVTDEGIKPLRSHPRLEHVSLRASGVSDASLRYLARIPTLTRLDLYGSGQPGVAPGKNFTIEGLLALKTLSKLDTIYLKNLDLTGGSYTGLKELKQVRNLSFFMCNVTDKEIDALEEAMPNTTITSSHAGGFAHRPKKPRSATPGDEE